MSSLLLFSTTLVFALPDTLGEPALARAIQINENFAAVKERAREVVGSGFNAGDGYGEVWIRDYNTFIALSAELLDPEVIEEQLLVFFRLQGEDGNVVDGFIPREKAVAQEGGYDYRFTDLAPDHAGHKNTVETDHESSLVQAVYTYVTKTGRTEFLQERVGERTVAERLEDAMEFLVEERWSEQYGLLYGATTADWGDVQHTHPWGVFVTDSTKYAVDIYDNAMFLIALDNLMELLPAIRVRWRGRRDAVADRTMAVLWDEERQKFRPHVYLDGSPYPSDFDEDAIYYHGGTITAIQAGLLDTAQVKHALDRMVANVHAAGAASIGLTLYPPYPDFAFENPGMAPWSYQNGGDWTWFGARLIPELVRYGFVEAAYEQLLPMTDRVVANDGFFEWYTKDNEPRGSGTFRGSAVVLYTAIVSLEEWSGKR